MNKNLLITIVLVVLVLISAVQAVQLNSVKNALAQSDLSLGKANSVKSSDKSSAASIQNLPQMVGGC
ncbi:hypothetical protein HYX01_01785 [Candidatus Woesearchaeota archaeon]|nr:hypothetical protein [Candidatus Woesearchaeota archaeon]